MKSGYINSCKKCKLAKQHKNIKKIRSTHSVYLLPEENYVGTTSWLEHRIIGHQRLGRTTEGIRVLYSTKNRDEALELEDLLHDIGYDGRHVNNTYK